MNEKSKQQSLLAHICVAPLAPFFFLLPLNGRQGCCIPPCISNWGSCELGWNRSECGGWGRFRGRSPGVPAEAVQDRGHERYGGILLLLLLFSFFFSSPPFSSSPSSLLLLGLDEVCTISWLATKAGAAGVTDLAQDPSSHRQAEYLILL